MQLLLTVDLPGPRGRPVSLDVTAELDGATPAGDLRDALIAWSGEQGLAPPSGAVLAAVRGGVPKAVDPLASVLDSGLLSGDRVTLVDEPGLRAGGAPATGDRDERLCLDVTSGPETGRTILLVPGRHVVGRSPDCDIVLNDRFLSRSHFSFEVTPSLEVTVEPRPDAVNGTFLAGRRIESPTPLAPEQGVFAGSTQMVLRGARYERVGQRDRLGQVPFNRPPYRRPIIRDRALPALDAPPERPGKRRFPMIAMAVPVVAAVLFVVILRNPIFLFMAAVTPMMMLGNFVSEGRSSRSNYARDRAEFLAKVAAARVEVEEALGEERQERMAAAPDLPLLGRQVAGRLGRLWERPRSSPDFLELRVGLGTQPSRIGVPIGPGGDPELRQKAEEDLAGSDRLPLVPVTLHLDEAGTAGLWGPPGSVQALGAALVLQAATLHSPEDLVVTAAVPVAETGAWSWLKWLPHCRAVTSPLEGPHLVDESGVDDLVRRLLAVASLRGSADGVAGQPWPRVLLVLHEGSHPNRAAMATLLDAAPHAGIVTLWLGTDSAQLPRQCRATIHCAGPADDQSTLRFTDPQIVDQTFDHEGIQAGVAEAIARSLAPVRDVSGGTLTTGIPGVVAFGDLPGYPGPDPAAIAGSWSVRRPYGLAATIGTGPDGPFGLDLVAEGPHALIAGTSGAGKSELLQTLVLALAARYPPQRLTFLFIDYKGGAASAEFAALPHTVGSVTNLDERLALRALASLRAELNRRMAVLQGRGKDLAELLASAPDAAPASLVIVVDEFATLVRQIPDFVAGIVDVAQRGRSLGIHLLLATQRPAGAVNDNILANTNLRIVLRVLDSADSSAVIGTRDAAGIPVPLRGRAYARTGPGAITPFQCAWSGAPFLPEQQAATVTVRRFGFSSASSGDADRVTSPAGGGGVGATRAPTQLAVMVAACARAADSAKVPPPRRPWVEPLPPAAALEAAVRLDPARRRAREADPGRWVVLGLADLPDEQRQTVFEVDLEASGGLLVFGAGGCGKTTLLRTVAAGLCEQGTPDEVSLYILDFGGRSLVQLQDLPHVVAAAAGDDLEKVTRILTVLRAELDRRRRVLAEARAESVSALRAGAGGPELPRLVLLLDSYAGFHATFEQGPLYDWVLLLQQLVAEGRQVGIHAVITTNRQLGVPTALMSAISERVVMRMATSDDLTALGVPRRAAVGAELGAGRAFAHGGVEVQVATVSEDPSGGAQAAAIASLADGLRRRGVERVVDLRELPEVVGVDAVAAGAGTGPLWVRLGLEDLTLAPAGLDLGRQNLVVFGPPLSGRSTALATAAAALAASAAAPRLGAFGSLTSPLADLGCWDIAGFGRGRVAAALEEAVAVVEGYEGTDVRLVVFMDAVEDLAALEHGSRLDLLVRSDAVRVVATGEPASIEQAYSGWLAELKRNRAVLVLQPASPGDVEALARIKPQLRPGQAFPPGRGVLVDRGRAVLVQVASPHPPGRRGSVRGGRAAGRGRASETG